MTIHKSQGGTFYEIVYEYKNGHPQELVYVALSRVTNIEVLFIVTPDDDPTEFRFHHNRVQVSSTKSLLQEFQRMPLNATCIHIYVLMPKQSRILLKIKMAFQ